MAKSVVVVVVVVFFSGYLAYWEKDMLGICFFCFVEVERKMAVRNLM